MVLAQVVLEILRKNYRGGHNGPPILIRVNVERTNQSDNLASFLDLIFTIEKDGKLSTKPYDTRDDFDFDIVNFPFLSSNTPSGPSYGVYISQPLDMQDAAHTMMLSDIAIKYQLKAFSGI